jgi:hypothetical protein
MEGRIVVTGVAEKLTRRLASPPANAATSLAWLFENMAAASLACVTAI